MHRPSWLPPLLLAAAGGTRGRVHQGRPRTLADRNTWPWWRRASKLFHGGLESKNTVSCDQCHPDAANTHPETYPKFQQQLGRVAVLGEMINWCIENPLESEPLALDDPRMVALQAYITEQRRSGAGARQALRHRRTRPRPAAPLSVPNRIGPGVCATDEYQQLRPALRAPPGTAGTTNSQEVSTSGDDPDDAPRFPPRNPRIRLLPQREGCRRRARSDAGRPGRPARDGTRPNGRNAGKGCGSMTDIRIPEPNGAIL